MPVGEGESRAFRKDGRDVNWAMAEKRQPKFEGLEDFALHYEFEWDSTSRAAFEWVLQAFDLQGAPVDWLFLQRRAEIILATSTEPALCEAARSFTHHNPRTMRDRLFDAAKALGQRSQKGKAHSEHPIK